MVKTQLSVRISELLKQHLTRQVVLSGVTMDQFVERALVAYLQQLRDELPAVDAHKLAG